MRLSLIKAHSFWVFCGVLLLYSLTLLPGLGQADTAEFQRVLPTHALPHPTGYPLYSLLGWIWTHLPLGGSLAWRANLLSAIFGALISILMYQIGQLMRLSRLMSSVGALSFATSLAFWIQATRAEVYTLAVLIQIGFIVALLFWRSRHVPFWVVGLIFGLGLAHHRMIVLLIPGTLLFVWREGFPRPRELVVALLVALAPSLLYLQTLMQIPPSMGRWQGLKAYVLAQEYSTHLLQPRRLIDDDFAWPLALLRTHLSTQFLVLGVPLQLLGAIRLIRRDQSLASFILVNMVVMFLFCGAYYVSDIDVFLIPMYALGALLLAQGCAACAELLPPSSARMLAPLALLLPVLLVTRNWKSLQVINSNADEAIARTIMAYPFPDNALLVGDWNRIESLRYLQIVEGHHPTLEMLVTYDPHQLLPMVQEALAADRAVYGLNPMPTLGLNQQAKGPVWKFENQPLEIIPTTAANLRWSDGIALAGYTLPEGPYRPAESIPLAVVWEAWALPSHRYSVFVHVTDSAGQIWSQYDGAPRMQTDTWQPNTTYRDLYALLLNPAMPAGRYHVKIGWYQYPSLERLAQLHPDGIEINYAILGEIEVN